MRNLTCLIILLLWTWTALAAEVPARKLAIDPKDLVAVELASVGIVPMSGIPVVLLREPESGSIVPIFIGPNEARAIVLAQRGIEGERPMTHDLLVNLMSTLGGSLERVVVDELRDGTYHGALDIALTTGDNIWVDTRPSDGLAMAVRTGAAILVAPDILEAGEDIPFEGLGDDVVTALGITVMTPGADLREALSLPDEPGVLVNSVRGMAAMAGVQPGAFIVAVNGQTPATPLTFLELVNSTESGKKAQLRYWHDGEYREIELDTDVPVSVPRSERRRSL